MPSGEEILHPSFLFFLNPAAPGYLKLRAFVEEERKPSIDSGGREGEANRQAAAEAAATQRFDQLIAAELSSRLHRGSGAFRRELEVNVCLRRTQQIKPPPLGTS